MTGTLRKWRIASVAGCGALALLALIPTLGAILRQFSIAIPYSKPLLTHVFLLLGFFAAMITTASGEHISITVTQFIKNERVKEALSFVTALLAAFILTVLAWDSASFIVYGLSGKLILFIPDRVFALVMPLGYAVMALSFAFQAGRRAPLRKKLTTDLTDNTDKQGGSKEKSVSSVSSVVKYMLPGAAVIVLGTVCALPAIAKLRWGFEPPEPFYSWVNSLYDAAAFIHVPGIIFLIVAALAGAPLCVCIGGIAALMLQSLGGEPEAVPIQVYSALTDSDLIALPLFTLTGFYLSESKAGERLVETFKNFFSIVPGGMILATVIICAFFTSFTGASGVTILALGGILFTILTEKTKYPEKFSIGLLTSTGGIGLLFPPSLPIILVGATTGTILQFMGKNVDYNIIHYFFGALIPGVILVASMIVFGIIASVKTKIPVETFDGRRALGSLKKAALEILLPVILIGFYFSGILSLVEISAVSVVYVFIIETIVHKDIPLRETGRVFMKALPIIGGILSILAMAKGLSYAIIDTDIPSRFTAWMQGAVESKWVFLLILNLALLVVGCLMDIFSAILVVLPLIVPLGDAYGIDPVHLGIIFITNLEVGFLTPPVGMNLFLASYRFQKPFTTICRYVLPFLLIQLLVVLLVTYLPALSTFLPSLVHF